MRPGYLPMRRRSLLLLGVMVLGPPLQAQTGVRIGTGSGQLGVMVDLRTRQNSRLAPRIGDREFRQWFRLPIAGTILSPRFLAFRGSVRATWQQRAQEGGGLADRLNGRAIDYSGSMDLLSASPVAINLAVGRASGTTSGGLSGDRTFRTSTGTGSVSWRFAPLPVQASVWRTTMEDRWEGGAVGTVIQSGYLTKGFRVAAANSRTSLSLTRYLNDDLVGPADFATWAGGANHSFGWGKGSRLVSRGEVESQEGIQNFARRLWSEELHLQHTRGISTDVAFRQGWNRTSDQESHSTALNGGLSAILGAGFSGGISYYTSSTESGDVHQRTTVLTPRLGLNLRLPGQVALGASGSAGLEQRRATRGGTLLLLVVDESHEVGEARAISLEQPDVDPATVTVRLVGGGAVLVEGRDYVLVLLGSLMRIEFPIGSRVETGQRVLVTYRHRVEVAASADAFRLDYDLSLSRRGVILRHRRSRREDRSEGPTSVEFGGLQFDEHSTSLEIRTETGIGGVDLTLVSRVRDRQERTSEREATGGFRLPPLLGRRAYLSLGGSWSEASSAAVQARTMGGYVTARVVTGTMLVVDARGQFLRWERSTGGRQDFVGGTALVAFTPGLLTARLRLEYTRQEAVVLQVTRRMTLELLRQF